MPKGETKINGKDAYDEWGISLGETALSTLMTPTSMKDMVTNESALKHGVEVLRAEPKVNSRDVSLEINLSAKSKAEFITRYDKFCKDVLYNRDIDIESVYLPGTIFHMKYISCNQFSQLQLGIAKFVLKLHEPNPADRL